MRKSFSALVALVVAASPLAAQRTVVSVPGANPNPTLSAGIRVGDMLYASGQLGGRDSTIEGQTKAALDNVQKVMEAGGTKMENVVKCTVFLVKQADFQGMNSVYRSVFPKDPPARSTVIVAALVTPVALVEIECMAVVTK